MSIQRIITRRHDYVIEVIEYALKHSRHQHTTIIICSTQDDFVRQLAACTNGDHIESLSPTIPREDSSPLVAREIPASQEDIEQDAAAGVMDDEATRVNDHEHHQPPHGPGTTGSHLLQPTLHQLAASQNIKLVFCPTITTFRAYISVFEHGQRHTQHQHQYPGQDQDQRDSQPLAPAKVTSSDETTPRLIIVDLIALHYGTSEFTLQGLSRTLARTASTAHANRVDLRLIECRDVFDQTNPNRGSALWTAKMPLLSGSVRIGAAGAMWAGRTTVDVGTLAGRWYSFE